MKTTAFTQKHIDLGAKMVPFAGYNMPIEYVGIKDEHNAVRNNVGVFDVSHMGEIWVKGPNALAFCQYVTTNDVSVLVPGKVQYSCFPNGKGGIVDDLGNIIYEDKKPTESNKGAEQVAMNIASLAKDGLILNAARDCADSVLREDPTLTSDRNQLLRKELIKEKYQIKDYSKIS